MKLNFLVILDMLITFLIVLFTPCKLTKSFSNSPKNISSIIHITVENSKSTMLPLMEPNPLFLSSLIVIPALLNIAVSGIMSALLLGNLMLTKILPSLNPSVFKEWLPVEISKTTTKNLSISIKDPKLPPLVWKELSTIL